MLKHYSTIKAKLTSNENGRILITRNSHNDSLSYSKYRYKYSVVIPLYSILALLLVGMIGNSYVYYDTYATNGNIDDSIKNSTSIENEEENSASTITIDNNNSNDDIGGERGEGSVDSVNYTISRAVSPSTSLTITTPNLSTIAPVGEVSYLSSNVTYSANDISSYSMKISYAEGNSSLSNSNITDSSGNTTTITGAGGKTPASMSSNTWGYALADTNANNTTLTYNTMPAYGSGTTIVSGNAESVPTTTKKLVFASKFAQNVTSGHYRTKVLLSLTATPKKVANIGGISTMQEMTAEICRNSDIGAAKNLRDTRDGSEYSIRKHEDGNCWMTQNLRIVNKTITPADSDVTANYTIPASSLSGFSSSNYYANQVYYANNTTNGAYYSWTAATAGTGTSSVTSGDAPSSVCPKGWKLPPNSGKGSYTNFTSAAGIANNADGSNKIRSAPYNFPYAGNVYDGSLSGVGSNGLCWSRTARSANNAYRLWFGSSDVNPASSLNRYRGLSIRCVATT